jgi:propanol-preferring alcohol dehydrogenase
MKAWQLTGANEPLRRIECDDPRPGPGQVVVDVRAAGICHSDVGFIDGTLTPMLAKLPLVLGHEVAGTVAEVGSDVTGFEIGERVAAFGDEEHAPGWSIDGGFADKFLAETTGLIKLPDAVDFVQAATATDAGQTAYGAVIGAGKLREGERVGIVGLGGLGLTGARIAVLAGAQVYAADPRQETWGPAKERGVLATVAGVRDLATFNLDMIVDCAGFGTTTAHAITAVRPGGRVIQVGLGRSEATISTAALVGNAVTLRGARGGRIVDFQAVMDLIAKGDLSILTTTISFEEIPEAIERLKNGDVLGRLVAVVE